MFPCLMTVAEDRHADRAEKREAAIAANHELLAAEFMAACALPLLATVSIPHDFRPARRESVVDAFADYLTERRSLGHRVIALLTRTAEGKAILEEMAEVHATRYEDVGAA